MEAILKLFGEYFFKFCKMSGYDRMLRTLGGNLTEFIENLDALHSYLALSYQVRPSGFCLGGPGKPCPASPIEALSNPCHRASLGPAALLGKEEDKCPLAFFINWLTKKSES